MRLDLSSYGEDEQIATCLDYVPVWWVSMREGDPGSGDGVRAGGGPCIVS